MQRVVLVDLCLGGQNRSSVVTFKNIRSWHFTLFSSVASSFKFIAFLNRGCNIINFVNLADGSYERAD